MSGQQQEAETGYWLIEPETTSILTTQPAYHGFASTFFRWVASEVSKKLDLPSQSIHLDVIEAEYHGSYPCLAAQHSSGEISDSQATAIESAIDELLKETTLHGFFDALISHQIPTGP